ncbi:MAG: hypothetical protein M3Q71_17795, partial [Chloroflexota bacterium]|nr:hypothetical protein [Chloroflexota bacterium]
VSSLLVAEQQVSEVLDVLRDDSVPEEFRDNMRRMLGLLAEQARFARRPRAAEKVSGLAA